MSLFSSASEIASHNTQMKFQETVMFIILVDVRANYST